jgi:hypothetical protein
LTVLGLAGQLHESLRCPNSPIRFARLKTASGADIVLVARYVSGVESTKTPGQDEPGRRDIPRERLSEMMRRAARKALTRMEDRKDSMYFHEGGDEIHKAALVIGGLDNVLIVFEEARNWRLVQTFGWGCFQVQDS